MTKNNKTWNDYYAKQEFNLSNIFLHYPYLFRAISFRPKRILEIGCGPAQHSLFIKNISPKTAVSVLDLDQLLLKKVKKVASHNIEGFYNIDILDRKAISKLPKYDLIISQGLLEHFKDIEFLKIIHNFSTVSKRMIFSIPSNFYQNQDFGNEILRSKQDIQRLLEGTGYNFNIRNYPLDIGIRTKMNLIKQNKFDFFYSIYFLLFISCHILVEIDYQ